MKFISIQNIVFSYMSEEEVLPAKNAVDGVSMDIEKGEFVIIVGPSGAGKTTVLNILGGMDTADEGQVLVDGSDIVQCTPRQLVTYRRHDSDRGDT